MENSHHTILNFALKKYAIKQCKKRISYVNQSDHYIDNFTGIRVFTRHELKWNFQSDDFAWNDTTVSI